MTGWKGCFCFCFRCLLGGDWLLLHHKFELRFSVSLVLNLEGYHYLYFTPASLVNHWGDTASITSVPHSLLFHLWTSVSVKLSIICGNMLAVVYSFSLFLCRHMLIVCICIVVCCFGEIKTESYPLGYVEKRPIMCSLLFMSRFYPLCLPYVRWWHLNTFAGIVVADMGFVLCEEDL